MNLEHISTLRLINQQLNGSQFTTAKEIVSWMGAIQAQDYAMAKWAIGVRLPGSTEKVIESAIDNGEIIRTHLLRPTWHFVSPDDIYWMLELSAPNIRSAMKSRDKQLELDKSVFMRSHKILEKALEGGNHLTRDELTNLLRSEGINTLDNRLSHLLQHAEIDQLICSGKTKNNQKTYALLSERVPDKSLFNRNEALGKLALRYFTSHGPATLKDFSWWSGLSVGDSKQALEMVKSNFVNETIANQTYWFTHSISATYTESIYSLPAYDEFIISYKDRTSAIPIESHSKAVSSNGIFWPILIENGLVKGIWKRIVKPDRIIIETDFFQSSYKLSKKLVKKAFYRYGEFLNKEIEIVGI